MEPEYFYTKSNGNHEDALIPGLTNNPKGMKKLLGVILLASVLNQTTFIFERNNTQAFEKYFEGDNEHYEPELVRIWWFSIQFISSLFSIWVITKIQPTYYYAFITVFFAIAQLVIAFVEKDKMKGYNIVMGICGGLSSGSVLLVPLYLLWRHFSVRMKGIVLAVYYLSSEFLSNVVIYFVLRLIWWGGSQLPKDQTNFKK